MTDLTLDELQKVDYPVKIEFDPEEDAYVAEFLDLPGCSGDGSSVEEAYKRAIEAKNEWLRITVEQGLDIPKPSKSSDYSGRVLLRMPTSLHSALADKASLYHSSLNQYIVQLLAGASVGYPLERQLDELTAIVIGCDRRVNQLTGCVRGLAIHVAMNSVGAVPGNSTHLATTQDWGSSQEWFGETANPLLLA